MRNKLASTLVLLISFSVSRSQEKTLSNSLYAEIGKTGAVFSLNYDHKFPGNFGIRAGGGSNFSNSLRAGTGGAGLYYLYGQSNRYLETGLDLYYLYIESSDDQKSIVLLYPNHGTEGLFTSINMGYRRYWKKTIFRFGASAGLFDNELVPGGYVSFGIRF